MAKNQASGVHTSAGGEILMNTKAARQQMIISLVSNQPIRSLGELADLLKEVGIEVSQGTLSKDMVEVGATRVRTDSGQLIYAVPGEGVHNGPTGGDREVFEKKLARVCEDVLVSAQATGNLILLRTPPGAAQFLASAVDKVQWSDIVGTIAGDDTVLVIANAATAAAGIIAKFQALQTSQSNRSE